MKKLFIFLMMVTPLFVAAQRQKTGNLTIFSEDGDKFVLVLNGEKQNDIAQANLRVEDLTQPYYNAKLIFADSTIGTIAKNNLMIADVDGVMMDVTYKIKKDKTRKAKLNYFSSIEVKEDFIPASGVYVYHYGRPAEAAVSNGTVVTTTTSTTNAVNANVNMPGISMNVTINDPVYSETTTTTTTTSSSSGAGNNSSSPVSDCNGRPMNSTDFAAALKTIGNASFDDSKLTTAKSISAKNCLSTDQVVKICNLFSFEESKLAFAKHAYKRTTDQKNYFKVNDAFSFDSSKEELSKFID